MRRRDFLGLVVTSRAGAQILAPIISGSALRNGIVLLGDSITARCSTDLVADTYDYGYWPWASYLLGDPLEVLHYGGVSGNTTAQILARVPAEGLAYSPKWAFVEGGLNDTGAVAWAETVANLVAAWDMLLGIGTKVIGSTVTPSTIFNTPEKRTAFASINAALIAAAAARPNVLLVDLAAAYADGGDASQPIANATYDGTHPSSYGALLLGRKIRDVLSGLPGIATRYPDNGATGNLFANPTLAGTGGTLTGGATGQVATSWRITMAGTGTVTASKVARGDGVTGEWQQIAFNLNAGALAYFRHDVASGFAPGDRVQAAYEIQANGDWVGANDFYLKITAGASSNYALQHLGGLPLNLDPGNGVIRSKPLTIPAGATSIQPILYVDATAGAGASGTLRIGRVELRKV
jgi:lysophospholipase L1-like esterase